jgi:SAM-dependent methyltransferase
MVRHLRGTLGAYQPNAIVGNGGRLPFASQSVDKVLCTGVLMHVNNEFEILKEMERVLRPGGILVCSMNNVFSPVSWVERVRNLPKKKYTQNYQRPSTYRSYLKSLGLELLDVAGDGVFSTSVLRLGRYGFPPARAFPALRRFDRLAGKRLVDWSHELWFTAIKPSPSLA